MTLATNNEQDKRDLAKKIAESIHIYTECSTRKKNRDEKGKSQTNFANNYTIIDIETTGLDASYDEIIEIGALKVRDNQIIEKFNTFVKPKHEINEFITELTGITNKMLESAPNIQTAILNFNNFLGDDLIIGHNVNFDVNFIYDVFIENYNKPFKNNFIDTMRFSRKLLPELKHHRLKDMIEYFSIKQEKSHRALDDCYSTFYLYTALRKKASEIYSSEQEFEKSFIKYKNNDLKQITCESEVIDKTNPFFNKICVFTGTLEKMERKTAAQLVVNLGATCGNTVTKSTNYLILGNNDYNPILKGKKSSKLLKAERYKLEGCDIEIISEDVFYDMLEN